MRSEYERLIAQAHPEWEYETVGIPYQITYTPDFETEAHYVEVKGILDAPDRAKLIKVNEIMNFTQVQLSVPIDVHSTQEFQEILSKLKTVVRVKVLVQPMRKTLVVCPRVSKSVLDEYTRRNYVFDSSMQKLPKMLSNQHIIRWCHLNQIKVAPWNENDLSQLDSL